MRHAGVIGAVVFSLALARSLADGFGLVDESWFLQVVSRVRAGEVLYRDVFLGVTPLSLYATTAVTFAVGVEIVAVKIVTNACFAATTVLSGRLAKQAGLSAGASWLIMAAIFVWGRPYANPPYTPMAIMFFVAALSATLVAGHADLDRHAPWLPWVGAGAWAGMSFASKQNVGLLALLCVLGVGVIANAARRRAFGVRLVASLAGFGAAVLAVLTPVAVSGGLPFLWDYSFAAKGSYVQLGAVPWMGGLAALATSLRTAPLVDALTTALHNVIIVLPVAVTAFLLASWRKLDRHDWTWAFFALAATAVAFPRWDRFHMTYMVPVHLIAMSRFTRHLGIGLPGPRLRRAATAGLVVLLVLVAAKPLVALWRADRRPSTLAHFRGPLISPSDAATLARDAERLRRAADGARVLLLTTEAGFWYLSSGIRNPTPFDIPAQTAMGSGGITWLLDELARAEIRAVCLDNRPPGVLTLVEVDAYVRSHFDQGPDTGPCTMYRAPERRFELEQPTP